MATGQWDRLPPGCHISFTQDGRAFFINDIQKTTSWLHSVTQQPLFTGLQSSPDLPPGWEQDVTNDGRVFFVNHNRQVTTFDHPVFGQANTVAGPPEKYTYTPQPPQSPTTIHKENFKRGEPTQRSVKAPTAKRNPNSEVVRRGFLNRLETSGISKVWKRRWCVLADFALFVYKNETEAVTLSSILLPSYRINSCTEADNIKHNFAFKVEHENTKTLYFAADEQSDCLSWMTSLRQAAMMNGNAGFHREANNNMKQFPVSKLYQDKNQDDNPQLSAPRDPSMHLRNQHNPNNRPNSFTNSSIPYNKTGHSNANQSLTYQGYGDPAESPLVTPTEHHSPSAYDNPIYSSHVSVQQPRQNLPNQNNSLSNKSNQGSQLYPQQSSRDNSFKLNQPPISANFPENQINLGFNSQAYPTTNQHPVLKDGFASDSARTSLVHSDSSRSGNPNQNSLGKIQQQPGQPSGSFRQPQDSARQHSDSFRQPQIGYGQQQQRDSYSDNSNNKIKLLNKWDQNFPPVDDDHHIHGSIGDFMNGRNVRQSGKNGVFNARSKSHENFSKQPEMLQQPSYSSHGGNNLTLPEHAPRNNMFQSQSNLQQGRNDRIDQGIRNGDRLREDNVLQSSVSQLSAGQQGPSVQYSPPYRSQKETQQLQQQSAQPWDNRLRGPQYPEDYHQQQGPSPSSNSPGGSSSRDYGSNSLQPNLRPHSQQPARDDRQQIQHGSLPRQKPVPPQRQTDLHLNLNSNPATLVGNQTQNSPHIYANLPSQNSQPYNPHSNSPNSSNTPLPTRPPYPSSVRQQIVEEIAQSKTPSTKNDLLTSNQLNLQRMQQPSYFQYPSPRGQQNNQNSLKRRNAGAYQQPLQNSQKNLNNFQAGQLQGNDRRDGAPPSQEPASPTNMMDPEAQKLLFAYERVHSLRMSSDKAPAKRQPALIQTVKEDPNMSDREVLETNLEKIAKKNPLSGPRLRMSISANDLIGKTHDELVLLLIQLRRHQAGLEKARDVYRTRIEQKRSAVIEYRKQMHQHGKVTDRQLQDHHQTFIEDRHHVEEVENKLEVYKPIINLLDNMVTMGSLFGGDNLMLATQYRKHLLRPDQYQPPKKMLEFSRKQQEERLIQRTEEEIKQLSSDEVDLEEKIDRLNELDRRLQEQSVQVSSFKEDKELMEKALASVLKQQDASRNNPREMEHLSHQQRMLETEISRVTQNLAEASKAFEQTAVENSKLEYDVALLRNKVHGELTRSKSTPSLTSQNVQTKMKMEKDLAKVEGIMVGLSKEGERLSQAMKTFRRSSSSSQLVSDQDIVDGKKKGGTYLQTDLDSGEQIDLANVKDRAQPHEHKTEPVINHQRQNANTSDDWDMEHADDNTKRFFGLVPKEKPKNVTVRDVKRQSEQRKEREKGKKDDDDDYVNTEEIKLRVSNVDNETSSIIHARIPSDSRSQSSLPDQWTAGQPLYENLHYNSSAVPEIHSAPGSRRSSLILMAPKPFTPYQDKTSRPFQSELELNNNKEPLLNSSFAKPNFAKTPGTNSLNRNSPNVEILKNLPPKLLPDRSVEKNPYENDYHNNSFGSLNQSLSRQIQITPNIIHARSQSDISGKPGFDEVLKPSDVRGILEQPTNGSNSWKNQDPPASAFHITRPVNFITYQPSRAYTARPWSKPESDLPGGLFNVKRGPKGRYLTISSSEPLKLETNSLLSQTLHSPAGDLILSRPIDDVPDIIKSSQTKVDQIDDKTIDREILYVPEKVLIPERYDPDADAEHLTQEEQLKRLEKAERIKRVLASQSVLSMSQTDINKLDSDVHSRVQQERTHILTLNQELARQVTLKSKKQAAERRKTWSGDQFAEAKRQYEQQLMT